MSHSFFDQLFRVPQLRLRAEDVLVRRPFGMGVRRRPRNFG